jgi:uncharacterized protein (DUF1697 family)
LSVAHVVFLRAANVGGNNVFRPAQLAAALSHLDAVNVGAAGTFVIRRKTSAATIRREVLSRLPFEPDIAIHQAKDIVALVRSQPFRDVKLSKSVRGWVAALCGRPQREPDLPHVVSKRGVWSCRVDRIEGPFAFGLWQRAPGGFVIPANVVEDAVGVPATVRWWETYERIARVIEA